MPWKAVAGRSLTPWPFHRSAPRPGRSGQRTKTPCATTCGRAGVALVWLLGLAASSGCVERRMTVRTNPPGALVSVSGGKLDSLSDEHELGFSPVSTNYVYNGTRRITLVKPGYATRTVYQDLKPRWYELFPLEFFAENVIPWRLRDHRVLQYDLEPQPLTPTQPLLERGEEFRRRNAALGTRQSEM
jgi:hypothetical protein